MSMESPSCMSDSLLAMAMAAYLQQRDRGQLHIEKMLHISFCPLSNGPLIGTGCFCAGHQLFSSTTVTLQSHLGSVSPHNNESSPGFKNIHQAENNLPWWCREFLGSRCLCDRGRSRGDRSLGEAACRAAGSRHPPSSPPGGRSACSDASHTATLCYKPDHKRCPEGGTGCCCVSANRSFSIITRI